MLIGLNEMIIHFHEMPFQKSQLFFRYYNEILFTDRTCYLDNI